MVEVVEKADEQDDGQRSSAFVLQPTDAAPQLYFTQVLRLKLQNIVGIYRGLPFGP